MNKRVKGTLKAAVLGGGAGFVAGLANSPADTTVNKVVPNVYGGAPDVVPTIIHHASNLPWELGAKVALGTAAVVGGAHVYSAVKNRNLGRQFKK